MPWIGYWITLRAFVAVELGNAQRGMRYHGSMILLLITMTLTSTLRAQDSDSPWGVSSSSSSIRNHAEWFPKMSAVGVRTVRLFPEWGGLQPASETWTWTSCDAMVKSAADNKIEINAILMRKAPWKPGGIHAFPMQTLPEWSTWVGGTVAHYKDQIRYWEVWNEGNAGSVCIGKAWIPPGFQGALPIRIAL